MPDRIYANVVAISVTASSGAAGDTLTTGKDFDDQFAQIDSFSWRWRPIVESYWPSGSAKQRHAYQDGPIEVTLKGGQVDIGFAGFINKQRSALKAGTQPPRIDITRTAYGADKKPIFTQKFKSGIIMDGQGSQAEGNKHLTNEIMVTFDDME